MGRGIFSAGRRGLAAAIVVACLVAPAVAAAAPTPDQAAAELDVWRTEIGELPVASATDAALNTGCAHHDNYEHLNGNALNHVEAMGDPGFTTDGAQAGIDSVLAEASGGAPDAALLPGPVWDSGVFHRAALLEPRLALTGFDSSAFGGLAFECMWIQNQSSQDPATVMDNTRTTSGLTLFPSPANGAYDVPTRFPAGSESPDPAQETGVPPGATLGWLLNVEINGPWANGEFGFFVFAHGVTATLAPDGTTNDVPVVVSQCGPSGCGGAGGTSEGNFFDGGFGIFPTQPLAANTTYRVVLTGGTVTDASVNPHVNDPIPAGFSWCFSTGVTYTVSADCAAPIGGAEEVSHPNASTTVSVTPTTPTTPTTTTPTTPTTPTSGVPPTGTGTPPGAGTPTGTGKGGTGTGSGSGTGTGSGAPTTGSGARHRRAARPRATGTLKGVRHGRPRLLLTLSAVRGGGAIRRVAIRLPHGMSFARHAGSLRSGVRVTSRHHRVRAQLRRHRGILTIALHHRARSVVVSVRRPALRTSRLLVRAARARHPARLRFSIATTTGASTTRRRLSLKPH
jgi:hypothetical protein